MAARREINVPWCTLLSHLDLTLPHREPHENSSCIKELFRITNNYYLSRYVESPTRHRYLIDLVLTNDDRLKLVEYLEMNEILSFSQHGFRSERSCLTQLSSRDDNIRKQFS